MKVPCTIHLLVALLFAVFSAQGAARAQKNGESFAGHVVAVTAGDTMDVRVSGSWTVTVRLHGTDCPTTPRALRETATRYTSRLVLDTDVRVVVRGTASRSVVYGDVFAQTGGKSLNTQLVRAGLARWASEYAPTRADLQVAENAAKYAAHGLWGATDGSNVQLPPSLADTLKRQREAKAAKVVTQAKIAKQKATPTPVPVAVAVTPQPVAPNVAVAAPVAYTPSPVSLVEGAAVFAGLTFLALVALAVGRGLPLNVRRTGAQAVLALLAGGCGAAVFALPLPPVLAAFAPGKPLLFAALGTFTLALLAAFLLCFGSRIWAQTARLRGDPVDPRSAAGFIKLHGLAKRLPGDLPCSDMGDVTGLYVRERTARYTAETDGARLAKPRWVTVRDSTLAADFELFSTAGDGTGSALVLAEQDDEQTNATYPVRWIPYHVARFYNEMPTDVWHATAYEGDTRTEVFFVPPNATVTVWGNLHPPTPARRGRGNLPVPRLAPDATGTLLICDGSEHRAYPKKSGAAGNAAIAGGVLCAAGAIVAATVGGAVAALCLVSALGIAGAAMLFLAVLRAARLARAAEIEAATGNTDPLYEPATAAWNENRRGFPGAVIAGAVS